MPQKDRESLTRAIRRRVPGQAATLEDITKIILRGHEVRLDRHRTLAEVERCLEESLKVLSEIVKEAQVDDAHTSEVVETLESVTDQQRDLATLAMGQYVDLFDPETLAKAFIETPTDRMKVAFRMIGPNECDAIIAEIKKVWPDPKVKS